MWIFLIFCNSLFWYKINEYDCKFAQIFYCLDFFYLIIRSYKIQKFTDWPKVCVNHFILLRSLWNIYDSFNDLWKSLFSSHFIHKKFIFISWFNYIMGVLQLNSLNIKYFLQPNIEYILSFMLKARLFLTKKAYINKVMMYFIIIIATWENNNRQIR